MKLGTNRNICHDTFTYLRYSFSREGFYESMNIKPLKIFDTDAHWYDNLLSNIFKGFIKFPLSWQSSFTIHVKKAWLLFLLQQYFVTLPS